MPKNDAPKIYMPLRQFPVGFDTTTTDEGDTRIDTAYHKIPEWRLMSHLGREFGSAELEKKIYIIDFIFTRCPGQCPKMSEQMQRIQNELIRDDVVRLVSVTIDPARDSVPVLKEYAKRFRAVPGKWFFMTGEKEEIYELAKEAYKLTAQDTEDPNIGEDGFIHSDRLILVDRDRHIRGFYRGTDSLAVNKLLADAVLLIKQAKEN